MIASSATIPLEVDNVTVDYGGLRALDGVSLRVDPGTTVGLIGPNGAGKTTLFDAVLGTVAPTSGTISVFGEDVTGWPMHRRARLGMGRTFQRIELFGSLSVLDNLVVAVEATEGVGGLANELLRRPASIDIRNRADDRANELLELVGLVGFERTRAADLSIGHSRLLELARALAALPEHRPKLLMLDEPSSGLNDDESAQLAQLLDDIRISYRLSLLVVEHDMEFVLGLCDHVVVLDFGKRIAEGTPRQIQRDPAVRAAYLGQETTPRPAKRKPRKKHARAARR